MGTTSAISKSSPAPASGNDLNARLRAMGLGTLPRIESNAPAYMSARTVAYRKLLDNAWKVDGKAACAQAMGAMRALNEPAKATPARVVEDQLETKKIPGRVSQPIKSGDMYGVTVETPDFGATYAFDLEREARVFSIVAERQRIAGTLTPASAQVLAGGIDRTEGLPETPAAPACDSTPAVQPESVATRSFSLEVNDLLWLHPTYRAYRFGKFVAEKTIDGAEALGRAAWKAKDVVVEKAEVAKDFVVEKAGAAKDAVVEKAGAAKDAVVEGATAAKDFVADKATVAKDAVVDTAQKAYSGAKSLWNRKLFTITIE